MSSYYAAKSEALASVSETLGVVVETGTFRGSLSVLLADSFSSVYTIEKSDELFAKHPDDDRVEWIHGDSRDVLPRLVEQLNEPVLWLLDAHYCEGAGVAGAGDFPLWDELKLLRPRRHADIVAVDDVHTFGKKRTAKHGPWERVTAVSLGTALSGSNPVVESWLQSDMFFMRRRGCS